MQTAEWIATAHLLRRAGFGTTGKAVDAALSNGDYQSTVDSIVGAKFSEDPGVRSTPMPELDSTLPLADVTADERGEFRKMLRQQSEKLTQWWLHRMVAVENPTLEKLTFIWHNHFATAAPEVRSAELMATQNASIRKLCLGDFRELAFAMLTDGAMLRWLNGNSNRAKSPNENLSREFLELFALGHGNGYSERDIREGARALTGYIVTRAGSVQFEPERHDSRTKSILHSEGNFDASEFCNIVLKQPESPRYIATRLWHQLASDTAPTDATLNRLVTAYGDKRDLTALTKAILNEPEFSSGNTLLISGPVDWYVGLLRTLSVPLDKSDLRGSVADRLRLLGQLPFYPPSVGGWPRGQTWLSTGTASLRIRAARMAVEHGDTSPVADASPEERVEAVAYLLGIGKWSSGTARALSKYKRNPTEIVVAAANSPEYLTT